MIILACEAFAYYWFTNGLSILAFIMLSAVMLIAYAQGTKSRTGFIILIVLQFLMGACAIAALCFLPFILCMALLTP